MGCVNLKIVDCPETVELARISLHSHLQCVFIMYELQVTGFSFHLACQAWLHC